MATGDLVTLTEYKTFGGETGTTNDTLLADLISAVSALVKTYCNRSFLAANHCEYLDGSGRNHPTTTTSATVTTGKFGKAYLFNDATDILLVADHADSHFSPRCSTGGGL